MVRNVRKIPSSWEIYKPIGSVIPGTRIFAIKTPLQNEIQKHITKKGRFTTADLFRMMATNGQSIGLVVNCSNTRRYYDKRDIEALSVDYKELFCPGRGFLARNDLTKDFISIIDDFMTQNKDNDLLIAVHCSDGINRSGYLICNYLICRLGWTSHDALNAFETARGYNIQRGSYVQALHKAHNESRSIRDKITNSNDMQSNKSLKRKEKKLPHEEADTEAMDMTPQVMHQLFQIGQQFNQVAESYADQASFTQSANLYTQQTVAQCQPSSLQAAETTNSALVDADDDDDEDVSDEDIEADDSPSNIDFDSIGRVDKKEPTSKSALRRKRRQKRDKMFTIMKKGRIWEINEMKKQM